MYMSILVTKSNFKEVGPTYLYDVLDMSSHKYCVVGNAHGFNDDYCNPGSPDYCLDCKIFSLRFNTDPKEMHALKVKFMDHWNSFHLYR
jgi:hypothetical protein